MHVEIWSDIACPWCYVGKRRFEAALADFEHADAVRLTWRSFELDPGAPAERRGRLAEQLAAKYGRTVEQAEAMQAHLAGEAAGEGLSFDFANARSGSTFDAHRLVHLAAEAGRQDAMKERLMRAYLEEGELMSDREVLARLAGEVGLDEAGVRALLESDRHADAVRADEQLAARLGIQGVPFFVADRRLGASGAQPAEAMLEFLRRAWEQRPAVQVVAGGEACGPDGC